MQEIFVWGNKYNNVGGHTGIATGKLDDFGKEIVFEENDPWDSKSHLQSYSLTDPNLIGFLRAKNSSSEISDKPNLEAILDEYLGTEGLSITDQEEGARRAVRFWLETFTTKERPTSMEMGRSTQSVQISTNLEDWASEIPTLLIPGIYSQHQATNGIFDINYQIGDTKREIKLKDVWFEEFGIFNNFSDVDRANGWQVSGEIQLHYLYKSTPDKRNGNDWQEWSEVISFNKKDEEWDVNKTDNPYYISYNSNNPKEELPVIVEHDYYF